MRSNGGKEGHQGLARRKKRRDGFTRSWGRSARAAQWEWIPEAAYTENTVRGKNDWGQIPWAGGPFFPPSNLPAGHPSGSTT